MRHELVDLSLHPGSYGTLQDRSDSGEYMHHRFSNLMSNEPGRSVTRSYYRGAAGVILVYDITKFVTYPAIRISLLNIIQS